MFQDLVWGIFKQEKWDQVISGTIPPENLESLDVTKVNKEVWLKISHGTKSFDLSFQKLQDLILKSICITSNLANEFYGARSSSKEELIEINSKAIKKCADTAMLLGKLNYDLLACRRELIIPELNSSYRQLTFVQGDHPKLLFGDDLPKAIKDISETNKVGQALKKLNFVPMNHTPSNQFQPQNFSPRGKPFLYRGQGKKRKDLSSTKLSELSLPKQKRITTSLTNHVSQEHSYSKQTVDFQVKVRNLKNFLKIVINYLKRIQ